MEVEETDRHEDSSDQEDASSIGDAVTDLMEKLEQSPYDYQTHLQLLSALSQTNSVQALRDARENMNKYFPLAPDIWLSWIRDESSMAESLQEKQEVLKICQRAVEDYLSVDVWLEYCQLSICLLSTENGAGRVREVFEQAITAAGLHVTRGSLLWEAYREFETCLLASAIESGLPESECRDKVTALFHRQLRVPLANMEATWLEYETWCAENTLTVSENTSRDFHTASKLLPELLKHEQLLEAAEKSCSDVDTTAGTTSSSSADLETAYQQYIQLELAADRPVRLLQLLERAVTASCLSVTLWQTYTRYLDHQLRPAHQMTIRVHERAVRNVPWCAQLWQQYILAAERADQERDQVDELFSRSLSVGFQTAADYQLIWLTWLEYRHRRLRCHQPVSADSTNGDQHADSAASELGSEKIANKDEAADSNVMESMRPHFEKASEHLSQLFGLEGDPDCTILQYWAELEAKHGNMGKSQHLWNGIMSQAGDKSAATWLKMIQVIRRYGTVKQVRKKFQEAMERTVDWPESVMLEWTEFERLYGTLSTWDDMNYRYRVRMKRVEQLREKQLKKESAETANSKHSAKNRKSNKTVERKRGDPDKMKSARALKSVTPSNSSAQLPAASTDSFKIPSKPAARSDVTTAESSGKRSMDDAEQSANKRSKLSESCDDPEKRSRTVFVSNLNFDVSENQLREFFEGKLNVAEVRLVKDYRERSKGFAYLELTSITEVNAALRLDRSLIGERPCFISRMRSEHTSAEPAFKYSDSVEENKLFVRGLATEVTADDLRSLFEPFGQVTDVRLVTFRNGHSKGIAYVEFSSKTAASQALLATDQQMFHEKRLTVAISNPPRRDSAQLPARSNNVPRQSSALSRNNRGRGPRLQLSFTPRSVRSSGSSDRC